MEKNNKKANRKNNNVKMNNNPQKGDKVRITKVPIGDWSVEICNLSGYTFNLRQIFKKDHYDMGYDEFDSLDVEHNRLVLTAQNDAGEVKIVRCYDDTLYKINLVFEKLKKEGYHRARHMYEMEESYTETVWMDQYYATCDYDFEEDILYDAFEGKKRMWVNFIHNGRFICRI